MAGMDRGGQAGDRAVCGADGRGAAAMVECWSELTERLARNSVSVQATNIGQQITVRDDQFEMAGKAELTWSRA